MSDTVRFGAIMAGGTGERFWPLSRQSRPKQLLHLTDPDRSMLERGVDLLRPLIPPERIYVVTGKGLVKAIRKTSLGIPETNIIGEPHKRNTSGAIAYITAHILAEYPNLTPEQVTLAVTAADHKIGDDDAFRSVLSAAMDAAESRDALVVCGVVPDRPATGFGYIQAIGAVIGQDTPCEVRAFHEKPSLERAQDFLESSEYFWNSGMFFWKVSTFMSELDRVRPVLAQAIREMTKALRNRHSEQANTLFGNLEDISIDYALMEHARNVLMIPGSFPWDDVGSWPALETVLPRDGWSNATFGEPVLVNCEGCIVYNEPGADKVAVGVVGARDLVIAVTGDAVLVIPKDRAQDVRHLVNELKRRNSKRI